jgi:hypothetical protein
MDIVELFCDIDDWSEKAQENYKKQFPAQPLSKWPSKLSLSEIMTIMIFFHESRGFRNFKSFYHLYVCKINGTANLFPNIVSYNRFVELMRCAIIPLTYFLKIRFGYNTGIAFIDSTKIVVCHNKRINSNRVFKNLAARGKSTMGWFYGFKLHLIINDKGEILTCQLTAGNVDDRTFVPYMTEELTGKLFGDKGYISKELALQLLKGGLQLITPVRKNMQQKLIPLLDKILLRKRSIIETVNDLLKNDYHIDHTRHRSPMNFIGNLLSGLIAYTYREKLPEINFSSKDRALLGLLQNKKYQSHH